MVEFGKEVESMGLDKLFFVVILFIAFSGCAKSYEDRLVGNWKVCGMMTPTEGVVTFERMKPEFKKMFENVTFEASFDRDGLAKLTAEGPWPLNGGRGFETQMLKWHIENGKNIVLTRGANVEWRLLFKDHYLLLEGPEGGEVFMALCYK